MHKLFREALEDATGESRRVIVVFIDIRGFSNFSQQSDSVDVAAFIRKVYMKIIDTYFDYASFFKSTGDGLLLTIPWEEKDLQDMSQKVIDSCIKCHSEFGTLFADDPTINFDVPHKIGIGVTRGSSCCLVSGDKTIDYSGRLLNLAARLTDLARPSGIVVDEGFVIDLLTPEQRELFTEDNVYLKGIHEEDPIKIYYTQEFTSIPEYNTQPIRPKQRKQVIHVTPYADILKMREATKRFRYTLESEPTGQDDVEVMVEHDAIYNGEIQPAYKAYFYINYFKYIKEVRDPCISVDIELLCRKLEKIGVKADMNITFVTDYIEK